MATRKPSVAAQGHARPGKCDRTAGVRPGSSVAMAEGQHQALETLDRDEAAGAAVPHRLAQL
jgi:hypothetical protein